MCKVNIKSESKLKISNLIIVDSTIHYRTNTTSSWYVQNHQTPYPLIIVLGEVRNVH